MKKRRNTAFDKLWEAISNFADSLTEWLEKAGTIITNIYKLIETAQRQELIRVLREIQQQKERQK